LLLFSLSTVEIELVIVVLNQTLFGSLAVVDGGLDLWLNQRHSGDNTLNLDEVVDKICFQASWSHIVLSEVTFEIDVVSQEFFWEMNIAARSGGLLRILLA
jgi:hypothetical protein